MITLADRQWNPEAERLLADGAWGTELMKRGLKEGTAPEGTNIDNPEIVREIALDYLKAGSDIILTNSFTSNRLQLERHGIADKTGEINKKAAEISAKAAAEFAESAEWKLSGQPGAAGSTGASGAGDGVRAPGAGTGTEGGAPPARFFSRPLVAGSIGPSGKLVTMKEISTDELLDVFSQQAENLAAGGADLILIETMTDLEEMRVAVRAVAKTGLPVIASVSYNKAPVGYRTMMGNSPEECIDAAVAEGASLVGANCGTGIENYMDLAAELCALKKAPVWIKANAGLPEVSGADVVYRQTPEEYASFIPKLLDLGVSVIGGCCGTTPVFLEAMRRRLDEWLADR